jgi:phosphotransferase system enzyme I (PtsI)
MATDERIIPFLVGAGIQAFSMDPQYIPRIQKAISSLTLTDVRRLAEDILRLGNVKAIEARLNFTL